MDCYWSMVNDVGKGIAAVKYRYLYVALRRLDIELNPGRRRLIKFLSFNAVSYALLIDCIAQAQIAPSELQLLKVVIWCWFILHSNQELSLWR